VVCSESDREARNCANRLGLGDGARAVEKYTDEVIAEHREKGARKVFSLGGLRLYECPLTYLTDETAIITRAVFITEASGHLPLAGGWAEQPAWFVGAVEAYKTEMRRSRATARTDGDGSRGIQAHG
jgi:hypothetical protein